MSIVRANKIQATDGTTYNVPIQIQHYENSTRTALSDTTSATLWSGINFTKKVANSYLHIFGQLVFSNAYSYNMGYWWQIGSSGLKRNGIFQCHYPSDASRAASIKIGWFINAKYESSETGILAVSIGWASINSGADRPGAIWNPNASDDARSQQHTSNLTIMEIMA